MRAFVSRRGREGPGQEVSGRPPGSPGRRGLGRRDGFALVAALWLLVALGAVGLQTALASRARRQATANLLDEVRARNAVMAGTEYARSRLTAAMLGRAEELLSLIHI